MDATQARLEGLVRALRPCRVAVVGDVMLDRYVRGRAERLSPEAPIQVLEAAEQSEMPGGAANVASKAAELGAIVTLVGLVGGDPEADALRRALGGRATLAADLVADAARPTTLKTRFIAHGQQLLRVDRERRAAPSGAALGRLADAARAACASADAVVLEDYGKGVLAPEVVAAALDGARAAGAPVVVDPNGRDYRRYAGATVLTPNLREAETAAERAITDVASLEAAAATLVAQTGAALAITREADGISLFRAAADPASAIDHQPSAIDHRLSALSHPPSSIEHLHIPTVPVAVFDVTGAGDAVAAAMAIALASGLDLVDACALANLAGRAVVRQLGVGTISADHLLAEARGVAEAPGAAKVADLATARRRAREVHQAGGTVVFTNGCFDILHYGHAHLLQFARAQGDFLILGLNTDASVRRQKGPGRPVVPERERAHMLALYPFVDLVVLFDEDTPLRLIEALRPDVLVKGGDYTPESVVGRALVEARGGRVAICPRLEGLSTTDLVRKILGRHDAA
jgi:D-beta-D-heptose 7-phosphate kinase/D-beta-D-heptose 1-phosphate adenosyltransferase